MNGLDGKDRELVLGRRTYEIFEAYWPYQPADNPIAQTLNAARKHVASRTLRKLDGTTRRCCAATSSRRSRRSSQRRDSICRSSAAAT
jgi:dihydrofolate reductase